MLRNAKIFCDIIARVSIKNFFLQNHQFQALLVSKTYIFINVKKNLHKIERPLTAQRGGGSRPYRRRPLRMQVFFDILPKRVGISNFCHSILPAIDLKFGMSLKKEEFIFL